MQRLPTVLLCHETTHGSHYDWLLGDPRSGPGADGRLWAVRTAFDVGTWTGRRAWVLWGMVPHRRYYLRYQGPLEPSGGRRRGQVRRADQGWIIPRLWTDARIVAWVSMRRFQGSVQIRRLDAKRYQATVLGESVGRVEQG